MPRLHVPAVGLLPRTVTRWPAPNFVPPGMTAREMTPTPPVPSCSCLRPITMKST